METSASWRFSQGRDLRGNLRVCSWNGAAATTSGWIDVPAVPVERIVTETGTGDVFTAAFLLAADLPLEERLRECASAAARHLQGAPSYAPHLGDGIRP
jgi:sugar/nucleoside kinase (ribokinase family)